MAKEEELTILIVEDDPIIRLVVEKWAAKKGWKTVPAEDGATALAACRRQDFDVILIDYMLPGMDGCQISRAMRRLEQEKGKYTPIIAMTADDSDQARKECFAAGMDDFLAKPVELKDFYGTISKWGNRISGK